MLLKQCVCVCVCGCVCVCVCVCVCLSKPNLHFLLLLHTKCCSNCVAVTTTNVRLLDSFKQALVKTALVYT